MAKAKSKAGIPPEQLKKCHAIIHTAAVATGAAGAIPIPVADTLPITAAQVTMVVALGKIFDLPIGKTVAKSIVPLAVTKGAGFYVFRQLVKLIPKAGSIIGAATAVAMTEGLGWIVADDFYRISKGEEPEDILAAVDDIQKAGIMEQNEA